MLIWEFVFYIKFLSGRTADWLFKACRDPLPSTRLRYMINKALDVLYTHSFTQSWTVHVHANTQTYTNTHTHRNIHEYTQTCRLCHKVADYKVTAHGVFFKSMIMPQH